MTDYNKTEKLVRETHCLAYIMKLLADDVFNEDCTQGSEFIYTLSLYLFEKSEELLCEFLSNKED